MSRSPNDLASAAKRLSDFSSAEPKNFFAPSEIFSSTGPEPCCSRTHFELLLHRFDVVEKLIHARNVAPVHFSPLIDAKLYEAADQFVDCSPLTPLRSMKRAILSMVPSPLPQLKFTSDFRRTGRFSLA
jgi:hypothetical protein